MATEPIPAVADLTAGWFTDLLRSTGDLASDSSVATVDLEPFGSDESMVSSLKRAALTHDQPTEAPSSLIVKMASDFEPQLFVAGMFKFYEREIRFYNEIASKMTVSVPRCYRADIDVETQSFILVIEEIEGRRQVDQIDGVGFDDAAAALTELADFQAPLWGQDLDSEAETFLRFDSELLHQIMPDYFAGEWAKVRPLVVDELPPEFIELCDRRKDFTAKLLQDMHGIDTLCHGDFRADNLLFDTDGSVLALDYQLGVVAHGMTDVAYFISQSVADDAAARADELINVYVERLAVHGIELDLDSAMDQYRAGLVFYLSIPVALLANETFPERAELLAKTMLRRASSEILRTGAHQQFG